MLHEEESAAAGPAAAQPAEAQPAEGDEEELPVGAAAVPDSGVAATAPADATNERLVALLKGASARISGALAAVVALTPATRGAGGEPPQPAPSGASSGGDPRYWGAGYEYQHWWIGRGNEGQARLAAHNDVP